MISPWLGMVLVMTALAGLAGMLRCFQRKWDLHAELPRKLMHVGMGLAIVTLPGFLRSPGPSSCWGD
jgi:hypothetical protein